MLQCVVVPKRILRKTAYSHSVLLIGPSRGRVSISLHFAEGEKEETCSEMFFFSFASPGRGRVHSSGRTLKK